MTVGNQVCPLYICGIMKKLLSILLPLCIFLSSGLTHVEGRGIEKKLNHFLTESKSVVTNTDALPSLSFQHRLTVRTSPHSNSESEHLPDLILKEQKDEKDTSQKSVAVDEHFLKNDFFQYSYTVKEKQWLFFKRLLYFPSYKSLYLLFEVFRI